MNEKIIIEFTGEEIDKILKYQRKLEEIADDDFMKRFPSAKVDTIQGAIMNAIQCGLNNPQIST